MFRKFVVFALALVLLFATALNAAPVAKAQGTQTIAEIAIGNSDFSTLVAALKAADPALLDAVSNRFNSLTVFAPTNAAFEKLFKALNVTAADVLANKPLLNTVLSYHVIVNRYDSSVLGGANGVYVGTLLTDNGSARSSFPRSALRFVVRGSRVAIATSSGGSANVPTVDIAAINGVIHVVDSVLIPDNYAAIAAGSTVAFQPGPLNITDTVVSVTQSATPEFTTLLAAVQAADPSLPAILSNIPGLTVFAPSDAAFVAALTALNISAADLLQDKATLNRVLAYHVVPGRFSASTIIAAARRGGFKVLTYAGVPLTITSNGTSVTINGRTKVVTPDVATSNGIVHAIDGVLLPQ